MARTTAQWNPETTMWWTQPKLALLTLAVNAVMFVAIMSVAATAGARITGAALMQVALLSAYWHIASRLGESHLAGGSEPAFERKLWSSVWKPGVDRTFLPEGAMPRADGASFYRQVLGDGEEARAALYRALSTWEGTRLRWLGSIVGLALAVGSSTAALALCERLGLPIWKAALASFTLPPLVLVVPEALNILLLRRAILHGGVVERVAVLAPRDAATLGLRSPESADELGWDGLVAMFVALGIPLLIVVTLIAGARGLLAAILLMVVGAVVLPRLWRAHLHFLVNTIPFLRFPGSPGVSVLLDLMHRKRATLSFFGTAWSFPSVSPFGLERTPILGPYTLFALGYLIAITFNDQYAGYWGYAGATNFEASFRRALAKVEEAAP